MDLDQKKLHVPLVDRTPLEAPPIVVAVVGPPGVSFLYTIIHLRELNVPNNFDNFFRPAKRLLFDLSLNDIRSII